jgi:hypothetical protein
MQSLQPARAWSRVFSAVFEVGNISKAREMSAIQVRVLKWVIPASKRDEGTLAKMKRKSPFLL